MYTLATNDLLTIAPMLIIMVTAMVVLMVDLFLPRDRKSLCMGIGAVGAALAFVACCYLWNQNVTAFNGSVVADKFALMFQMILCIVVFLSFLLSERYIQQKGINYGEYYALMLFSASGAMLMAASRELITIFVGLEVLSIALYVLSGFARTEARSEESAMKYFLLGSFSSGFFLYGIALVYGGTAYLDASGIAHAGTTRLDFLSQLPANALAAPYTVAGIALLIVGLGFKAAIVPFHSWTPDVYEGAPTSVTAFMSAGAKAGAFAAFVRVATAILPLSLAHLPIYRGFHDVLWVLALLTMISGNVLAIVQTNIKRMLAYSSIAHAGYILVGLLAQNQEGHAGILFYVMAYTFMNLGAFGVIIILARRGQELTTIEDLQGLASRQPIAAAMMALFMLSLAGIPPTAGFMGKLYLFLGAIHAHQYGLAVVGLVASVIGVAYYLRIIYTMYFLSAKHDFPTESLWRRAPGADIALIISAVATLGFGIMSGWLYDVSSQGADSLGTSRASVTAPLAAAPVPTPAAPAPERVGVR